MLKLQYRIKTGRKLNLKNPKRYTEKLQWYKLYYRDQDMVRCADKYDVRSYIEELGLSHILNECYGVYDTAEEIDFDKLPNQFVLKDTLGGGGNSVLIVRDKATMDIELVKTQLRKWVNEPHRAKSGGREWPYYSGKKHRIIVERYIESDENAGGLIDYKFFCFYGKVAFLYGIADRIFGQGSGLGIFDKDFCRLPYQVKNKPLTRKIKKPDHYDDMLVCAKRLSEKFPHARVDLYNLAGKVIFGEITFYDASGYTIFDPDEFDFELGDKFILPPKMN